MSDEVQRYRTRTTESGRRYEDLRRYLPGGDSRSTLFYLPYPAVLVRGEGCRVVDLDGNRLLDFTGNHSALVHGYGAPRVMEAIRRQLEQGTCFAGPTEVQLHYARHLVDRIRSLERVRFTNSGTEAVMMAVRGARRFTGRRRIAKLEGGYHGTSEDVMGSGQPDLLVLPPDNAAAAVALLERHAGELAALLVEPVQGSAGMLALEAGYLESLREATRRLGILLVFDEVVSLRIAYGGAEEHFGITPDMTCLGKLIGGGFPLGAFGGRQEIMTLFDPSKGPPAVPHPGSYNANPVSLAAGLATMELLTRDAVSRLNAMGDLVRRVLADAFDDADVQATITGLGSLFGMHPMDATLRHRLFLGLYDEGVLIDPRGVGTVSTAIGEPEIEELGRAVRSVLVRLAPHVGSISRTTMLPP